MNKTYDCTNSAPDFNYTPFGLACWWNKSIPNVLKAKIGPVVIPTCDPACQCYNFPTSGSIDVTFERASNCDWESGVIVWQCSAFDYPLTLFVNTYEKIYQDDPDINPIGNVFSFSGDPNPSGSCSWDAETGQTTGTISGVAEIPPQGCSCDGCLVSYILYFDESL